MNVLLIRAELSEAQFSPHLGLGYLSASLKQAGHKVKVLDGLREKITYNKKTRYLFNFQQFIKPAPPCRKTIDIRAKF